MYNFSSTSHSNLSFKLPSKNLIKGWVSDIAAFASDNLSVHNSEHVRASVHDARINLDLYDGTIDPSDFVSMVNPMELSTLDVSRELHHYPIAAPILDLLTGEEINKPYEPIIEITNNVGMQGKSQRRREYVDIQMQKLEQSFEGDEKQLAQEVKRLTKYMKYTYKDIKEMKASALFDEYYKKLNVEAKMVEGYRGMWNTAEEAYAIDIVNKEPTFEILDTTKLRTWGSSNSSRMEDADILAYENHFSAGKLIDMYGDLLSKTDIDDILEGNIQSSKTFDAGLITDGQFIPVGSIQGNEFGLGTTDSNGNIRHLRIRWKAYVEYHRIAFKDPATGEEQEKLRFKAYKLQDGEARTGKTWGYQWWICTLIGDSIIVDAKQQPILNKSVSKVSEGHPGVVGEVYNMVNRVAIPAMTKMRSQQYMYDVIMDNIIVAMSKNIGPILDMDMSKKPDNWDVKKWLSFIYKYNMKFKDSFREINKGSAKGQLAGNLTSGQDSVQQLDFGNYIQQLMQLAEYMRKSAPESIGISQQRLGSVGTRETVGGVERATSQSSHVTEWYSFKHENVKNRACDLLVNAAIVALDSNPKLMETMVEDRVLRQLDIVEDDFSNTDLGIRVTDSTKAHEYKNILEQSAHAHMQNGGKFGFVFDILFSNSMAEKRRLIEAQEDEDRQAMQEEQARESEQIQTALEAEQADKQADRDAEKYKVDLEAKVKLKMKQMDVLVKTADTDQKKDKTIAELHVEIEKLAAFMDADANKTQVSLAKEKTARAANKEKARAS